MNFCGFNNFDDFMSCCGYTKCNQEGNTRSNSDDDKNYSSQATNGGNSANNTRCGFDTGCYDIPGGFQGVNPQYFVVIAQLIGDVLAGNLPCNVQSSIGNWLELVGQAILTYSAQQQYFEDGPGRFFNPINYNVNNDFCKNTSGSTDSNTNSNAKKDTSGNNYRDNKQDTNNKSSSNTSQTNSYYNEIKELKNTVDDLMKEIEEIKNKLNHIEN